MNDSTELLASQIQELLGNQLRDNQLDIIEVVDVQAVPNKGDRMVRLRTLEEALHDFDGYLIKIKPRKGKDYAGTPIAPETIVPKQLQKENLYQQDGKLNVPFLFRNAELLFASGDYALSRNVYKAIFQSGLRTAHALDGMGRCYEAEGKLEDARAHYEESIAYLPNLEAMRHLASLFIKQKKEESAAETLERALQLKEIPSHTRAELHKAAGNCWLRVQRAFDAQHHYERALEINPKSGDIRANLGVIQLQAGKIPEAKMLFQDALASDPRNDKALAGLASCFLAEGDRRMAHEYFAKALELELNNPTAIYHLVKCAYELKTYATAARVLEEYVQIAPVNANLLYSLAGLQFHMGRIEDALQACRKVLQISPDHSGATELITMIEKLNRRSDAS
jgi:tetratricopeptide (TPR) repeat protein